MKDGSQADPVSRRAFLKSAAGTTATAAILGFPTIVPSSVLGRPGSSGQVAPSNRITMALIGCGGMGRGDMGALMRYPEVQFVAVCDPDLRQRTPARQSVLSHYAQQSQDGTYRGCDDYNDFREVLARDDIDAVVQATPDHWHALVVTAAARAGKDIYGEKPLSLTIAQGRIMSDAVRQYGRVFQTGSQQRSDGRFRFACELVRNGRIGTVHRVTCGLPTTPTTGNHPPIPVPDGFDYDLWLGPAPWMPYCQNRTHWNFRWILDYSGGQVTDWGAHHIDIAHWGLGLQNTGPVKVEGVGEYPADGLWDAATNYRFVCKYDTGVELVATNNFENGVKWEGDDGWVFANRGRIDAEPKSLLNETIGPNEVHLPRSPGHHRNFLDCVASRREPIAPIEQAHRTITVAHLGNIAMQLGRRIRWDPDAETIIDDPTAARMVDRAMREPWTL
ncbi:MAG: gfo/Idh/MocA family oxidoreductase [Planctomycetes bacterium]|nr:gfo/Idh/MocA family oxidoreductase [Planctomycetota bacterium]NOG54871.1 Gfo/Idh/MocA family oxidoreductase [Planctomycetota bacterium]